MTKDYIRHQGRVERIEEHKVYVRIEQKAACSDCHAKSACLAADRKEKIIEINDPSESYDLQEEVTVLVRASMGFLAILIAFVMPLLLVIVALMVGLKLSQHEGMAGLIGLSTLIPYYLIIYLFRNKLKHKFIFTLSKNTENTSYLQT